MQGDEEALYYDRSRFCALAKIFPSQPRAPPPHCAQNRHTMGTPAAALHDSLWSVAACRAVPHEDRENFLLFVPQRFDWIEPGGFAGGIVAEENAHGEGEEHSNHQR